MGGRVINDYRGLGSSTSTLLASCTLSALSSSSSSLFSPPPAPPLSAGMRLNTTRYISRRDSPRRRADIEMRTSREPRRGKSTAPRSEPGTTRARTRALDAARRCTVEECTGTGGCVCPRRTIYLRAARSGVYRRPGLLFVCIRPASAAVRLRDRGTGQQFDFVNGPTAGHNGVS